MWNSAWQLSTLRPSQPTWAARPFIGCYCLHPPSASSITQPKADTDFTVAWWVEGQVDIDTAVNVYSSYSKMYITVDSAIDTQLHGRIRSLELAHGSKAC